jgi:hypothetical protein
MASSDEQREPLLRKDVKYYDNFLGYEVEERKEKQCSYQTLNLDLLNFKSH